MKTQSNELAEHPKIQPKSFTSKNGVRFTIRTAEATEKDAMRVLGLGKEIISEELYSLMTSDELTLSVLEETQWIEKMNTDPNGLLIIAECDQQIVGMIDFTVGHRKRISHTGDFGMGVKREFRGTGIGSALLQVLLEWAEEHPKIEKVNLKVHADNKRAIHLYENFGFKKEGQLSKDLKYEDIQNGDRYVDTIIMAKFVS